MKFTKIISCDDRKIEITEKTQTSIDKEDKDELLSKLERYSDRVLLYGSDEYNECNTFERFDIDKFLKIYGDIPCISEIRNEIDKPIEEVPFHADFWESFCYVLSKSASAGFLGFEGSECLSIACKSMVPKEKSYTYTTYRDPTLIEEAIADFDGKKIDKIPESTIGWASYRGCKNIKLVNRDHIIITAEYDHYFAGVETINMTYPYQYLELIENVEAYLVRETAPKKYLFQKEPKSPALSKGNKMIMDFFQANKKEIRRFKTYAKIYVSKVNQKESLKEDTKKIYHDMLIKGILVVDGKKIPQKYCEFDIYEKKEEIDAIVKKLQNSNDAGEDEVEYAIKWLRAESSVPLEEIRKNCESQYRYGCILLKKSSFIEDAQEYDHILVSDMGIILIETKHWKGQVDIHSDGKWVRDPNNDGQIKGIENPLYQIQRHEALMKSILPHVPIHSLLVFSNPSLILKGSENCNMCRVIYLDKLKETVMNIFSTSKPIDGTIDDCVNEIEKYKVNIMGNDISVSE